MSVIVYSKDECAIGDCTGKITAKGLCQKHYMRARRGLDPTRQTTSDPRPATIDGGVAKIPLGLTGEFALVDAEDHWVSTHLWHKTSHGYVATNINRKLTYLHRMIMGVTSFPKEVYVDHKNHDRLDNRKENLRLADNSLNQANRDKIKTRTGFRGVVETRSGKFAVFLGKRGKRHFGTYGTAIEAANKYNELAKDKYGDFAQLNRT